MSVSPSLRASASPSIEIWRGQWFCSAWASLGNDNDTEQEQQEYIRLKKLRKKFLTDRNAHLDLIKEKKLRDAQGVAYDIITTGER